MGWFMYTCLRTCQRVSLSILLGGRCGGEVVEIGRIRLGNEFVAMLASSTLVSAAAKPGAGGKVIPTHTHTHTHTFSKPVCE